MVVLAEHLEHERQQLLVVFHHENLAGVLADEDGGVDRVELVLRLFLLLLGLLDGEVVGLSAAARSVYLRVTVVALVIRQVDREGGSLALRALAEDVAMVQFHQVVGQRQSDASARHVLLTVIAIEEAGVEMLQLLLRHADSMVLDRNRCHLLVKRQRDGNLPPPYCCT